VMDLTPRGVREHLGLNRAVRDANLQSAVGARSQKTCGRQGKR
jgi:hypothetical protein